MQTEFLSQRRKETSEDDDRSPAERDYGRVIHSAAFRRLQNKTQVLGLGDSDFYRTRLTHTMEVAQIGESIVRRLREKYQKAGDEKVLRTLPSDMEIRPICLAHDLGHPPFGHGGEVALNRCMFNNRTEDPGFEGNGQTLRILSRLEPYTPEFGMNPTRRTLLGILKYPARYSDVVNPKVYEKCTADVSDPIFVAEAFKPPKCYLDVELDVVDWVFSGELEADRERFVSGREVTSGNAHQKTSFKALDTSIMEIADDIAYGIHDLEDALSLKLIDKDQIGTWLDKKDCAPIIQRKMGFSKDEFLNRLFSNDTFERKTTIGWLVHICVCSVSVFSQNTFQHSLLDLNARMDHDEKILLDALQDFFYKNVVKDTNVQHLEFKGQKIISDLFKVLSADPERLLTSRTMKRVEAGSDLGRVICDHISGMTDIYAAKQHNKLFTVGKGSVFDQI